MMAFSGVRSSWDMFARNCDLCWLAPPARGSSPGPAANSRAFSIARTDWLANVWSRSTTAWRELAGRLAADHQRADDPLLADERDGEQGAEAGPCGAHPGPELGASTVSRRRGPGPGRPARAAPPPDHVVVREAQRSCSTAASSSAGIRSEARGRRRSPSARRARRSCRRRRRRGGRRARRSSSAPPGGRARTETAWLTSPSACSSSTRVLQLLEQAGVLDGDDGLVRERLQQRRSAASVNGRRLRADDRRSPPIASPSRSSGTDATVAR